MALLNEAATLVAIIVSIEHSTLKVVIDPDIRITLPSSIEPTATLCEPAPHTFAFFKMKFLVRQRVGL